MKHKILTPLIALGGVGGVVTPVVISVTQSVIEESKDPKAESSSENQIEANPVTQEAIQKVSIEVQKLLERDSHLIDRRSVIVITEKDKLDFLKAASSLKAENSILSQSERRSLAKFYAAFAAMDSQLSRLLWVSENRENSELSLEEIILKDLKKLNWEGHGGSYFQLVFEHKDWERNPFRHFLDKAEWAEKMTNLNNQKVSLDPLIESKLERNIASWLLRDMEKMYRKFLKRNGV